jgi:exonuclease SbcC
VEAEAQGAAIPALEQALRELQEKRPVLLELSREAELLRQKIREAADCAACCRELTEKKEALAKKQRLQQQELSKLQGASEGVAALEAQWEALREGKDALLHVKTLAEEAGSLASEEAALQSRISADEARQRELNQKIPGLEGALQDLERSKVEAEQAHRAAHLAASLVPGEPCPVCGSPSHPCPAIPVAAVSAIDQPRASLARSLKEAERDAAVLETALHTRQEELRKVRFRWEGLATAALQIKEAASRRGDRELAACFSTGDGLPDSLAVAALLTTRLALVQELSLKRKEAQNAATLVPGLYETLGKLQGILGKTEQDYAVMAEKHRTLETAIEALKEKRHRFLAQQGLEEYGVDEGQEALRHVEQAMQEQERRITAYREAGEQALRELAASRARETLARTRRDTAARQLKEAENALQTALAPSPFATSAELQAAILSPAQAEDLERAITRWREAGSRLTSLRTEVETGLGRLRSDLTALGGAGEADLNSLRLKGEALAQTQEQAELKRDTAQGELLALERDAALLKEARERYDLLAEKSGRLQALAGDLAGKNPKKRSFDAWLLGLYLAEVAAFATKRLERMSESRYALILDLQRESGRGLTGLDLAVFDGYTGKARPCATLSGGESFMASISLALGLADSIQARSGGVRLDAVFIDEGFGSLDEGNLDKALAILDELRDHRMVGLISHVGELRSRIPCHIEVIKSRGGSTLRQPATLEA